MRAVLSFAEEFLWILLSAAITAVGLLIALIGMWLNHFHGTKSARTSLACAILTAFAAIALWLIYAFVDPLFSMIFAVGMSLATFMTFASWLSRYDRN